MGLSDATNARTPQEIGDARFRAAIESSIDAVFILTCDRDASGRIVDFVFADLNARGAAVLGIPREHVLGQRLCELRPVNRTHGFFERYLRVFETGEPLEEEAVVPLPEGGRKWVHTMVVRLPDGIALTSRDVTVYRKLEADLREALERAEQYADALEEKNRALAAEIEERTRTEVALLAQQETILSLSTPIVEAWEGILLLPLIGKLDEARAALVQGRLLEAVARTGARFAILDLTGVGGADAATVEHLLAMARAASLLGSRCLLSGIGGAVARAIVETGADVSGLPTFARMRDAVRFALKR
jgi:anti-anti-sigma regulatory factor